MDELLALADKYTEFTDEGFSINIKDETEKWNFFLKKGGIKAGYKALAKHICERYKEKYGKEFLFSDKCVAYEIEYHVDAYMCAMGYSGYIRNITSFLFTKDQLKSHCEVVDIYTYDWNNFRQKTMFRYRAGIRKCYRGTDADPYRRKS